MARSGCPLVVAALAAALDLTVATPVAALVANCRLGLRQTFHLCIEAVDLQFAGQRDRRDLNSGLCSRLDLTLFPGRPAWILSRHLLYDTSLTYSYFHIQDTTMMSGSLEVFCCLS